ncbi:MAG: hypothetical protein HYS70_02105 [Nitrospinae bacterium]|nr:hypothetical protein [Nitrospinota bacterium]
MHELRSDDMDAFFRALARKLPCRVKIIVTGGAEGLLLGSTRPTRDIDFGILLRAGPDEQAATWEAVESAIMEAAEETGVTAQYAQDIDRWSSVAVPRYDLHTRFYRRFGCAYVHLLEPAYWAVYKLARYLDADVADLIAVLRTQGVPPRQLAKVCGKALRSSPRSSSLFLFRRHVEHFFREHGPAIWGQGFDPCRAIAAFHHAAGIQERP